MFKRKILIKISYLAICLMFSGFVVQGQGLSGQEDPLKQFDRLFKEKNFEAAIQVLYRYIETIKDIANEKSNLSRSYYNLARIYYTIGDIDNSEKCLVSAFDSYPELRTNEENLGFKALVEKARITTRNNSENANRPVSMGDGSKISKERKKFPWLLISGIIVAAVVATVLIFKKKSSTNTPTTSTGSIQVESTPTGAKIYLDGIDTGKTTNNTINNISTGNHTVKLVLTGFNDYEQSVVVQAGQTATITATLIAKEPEMIRLPGGTFMMGSESSEADGDEKPVHQVTVSGFEIGKYEVTQAEWEAVMGSNPSSFKGSRLPVEMVSWDDIQTYLQKLNTATGKSYRLPTEAEWEYACRAGTMGDRYGSLDSIAWYAGNSGSRTHDVGGKTPNGFGLYDMLGNDWEWCSDWYGLYSAGAVTNPKGSASGADRVNRGGAWDDSAQFSRASNRNYSFPDFRGNDLGFRLARD